MRWTVVAGDRREGAAAGRLAALGHRVLLFGRPAGGAPLAPDAAAAFGSAEAVLGPALGTNAAGDALRRPEPEGPLPVEAAWLDLCPAGTPWLVGQAGPWLAAATAERGLPLLQYARCAEYAALNAIPTAEGAIAEACRRAGRTAWDSAALVVGGGHCAQALVQRLTALGCAVACAARDPAQRAQARRFGALALPLEQLPAAAAGRAFLFNTVPAPLVTRRVLEALPPAAIVLDLASAPGGTDFAAAEALGLAAALLPAIPGRSFPETAGRIIAEVAIGLLAPRRREAGRRGGL